jgi:peptidoglycan biosynthesis protein MviN/MurJ (putative lipid II flippase)
MAAAVLLLFGKRWDTYAGAFALAIAAVAQFAVHWKQLRLQGSFVRPQLFQSGLDGMLRATFPILLSVVLTNLVLPGGQRALTSDLPVGTFATTNYALRLLSLVSLLTLSVYTVAATDFAQKFQEQGLEALRVRVVGHVQALAFVLAPATIVLMALSRVLVELAFLRGRYPASAVSETAMALWLFSFALLPAGVAGIFHILFSSINQQFRFLLVNIPFVITTLVMTAVLEPTLGAAVLPVAYVGGVVVNLAASIVAAGSLCGLAAWTALGRYVAGLLLRLIVSVLGGALAVLPMTGLRESMAWIRGDAGTVEALVATAAFLASFVVLSRVAGDHGLGKMIGALTATAQLWRKARS